MPGTQAGSARARVVRASRASSPTPPLAPTPLSELEWAMGVRRSSPPLQAAREAAAAAAARRAAGRRSDRRRCRTSYRGMLRPLSCTPQHIIHLLPPTAYHMTAYSHASIRSPCSTPLAPRSASARQDRRVRNCIKQKNCIARGHRAVCAENQDGDTGSFPNDCVSKREGGAAVFCGILRAGQLVLWHS